VKVCSWNNYIAPGTNKFFIPQQVIPAGIAQPGKEQTDKIIKQIIKVTHAAMQNYFCKDMKIFFDNPGKHSGPKNFSITGQKY
jgi:hypothetical protein